MRLTVELIYVHLHLISCPHFVPGFSETKRSARLWRNHYFLHSHFVRCSLLQQRVRRPRLDRRGRRHFSHVGQKDCIFEQIEPARAGTWRHVRAWALKRYARAKTVKNRHQQTRTSTHRLLKAICWTITSLDATTHLYKRSCPSVRPSVGPSVVPCYFRTMKMAVFKGKKSSITS